MSLRDNDMLTRPIYFHFQVETKKVDITEVVSTGLVTRGWKMDRWMGNSYRSAAR